MQAKWKDARKALRGGEWQRAARLFAQLAEEYQDQGDELQAAEARNNQAAALMEGQQYRQALKLLEPLPVVFLRYQDLHRAALAWGNLGLVYERLGQRQKALQAYRRSLELLRAFPDTEEDRAAVHRGLARVYARQRQWLQALDHMVAAITLHPRSSLEHLLQWWFLRQSRRSR